MQILIDTNVLLRSIESGHVHNQSSLLAIELLKQTDHELVVVPQVLYELWSVATRPLDKNGLGMAPAQTFAEIHSIRRLFHLLRDERGVYTVWELLVSSLGVKGKQAHDARLAAAMRWHNIGHLLTFNTADFGRYSFITAFSPVDLASGKIKV